MKRKDVFARSFLMASLVISTKAVHAGPTFWPESQDSPRFAGVVTPSATFGERRFRPQWDTCATHILLPFAEFQVFASYAPKDGNSQPQPSSEQCSATLAPFMKQFNKTALSLDFTDIGPKADTLVAILGYSNPAFLASSKKPAFLASGRDRFSVQVQLKVKSCDNTQIGVTPGVPQTIDDVMASLRDAELKNFFSCELEAVGDPVAGDLIMPQKMHRAYDRDIFISPRYPDVLYHPESRTWEHIKVDVMKVMARKTGDLIISRESRSISLFGWPSTGDDRDDGAHGHYDCQVPAQVTHLADLKSSDPAEAAAAKRDTANLVEAMRDYGEGLLLVKDKSLAAKRLYTQQFIEQQGPEMRKTLGDLRSRVHALGLVDLISVNVSIQQAYGYVRLLESKIAGEYSMDSVIRTYAN